MKSFAEITAIVPVEWKDESGNPQAVTKISIHRFDAGEDGSIAGDSNMLATEYVLGTIDAVEAKKQMQTKVGTDAIEVTLALPESAQ